MEKKKTYVLDTTVLIYDPDIFYKLGDADIVVPLAAIKELDGLKKSESDLVSKSAREVSRMLDRISSYSDMRETGGKVSSGARIFIETSYEKVEGLASEGDQKITGTALYLKKKGVKNLILATTDTNMRIVGRTYGINVEHYPYKAEDSSIEYIKNTNNIKTSPKRKISPKKLQIMRTVYKTFKVLFSLFGILAIIGIYGGLTNQKGSMWNAFETIGNIAILLAILFIIVYQSVKDSYNEHTAQLDDDAQIYLNPAYDYLGYNVWHETDNSVD